MLSTAVKQTERNIKHDRKKVVFSISTECFVTPLRENVII